MLSLPAETSGVHWLIHTRCHSPALRQGPLATALTETFGSVDGFINAFTQKAVTLFGSGWVWLYVDHTRGKARLSLTTTPNQDTPAMTVCLV